MATITVRRLDDDVARNLKESAAAQGQSLEEHVRRILANSASARVRPKLHGQEAVDHFRKLRDEIFGDRVLPDSTDMLREMRDEDPTRWTGV